MLTIPLNTIGEQLEEAQIVLFAAHEKAKGLGAQDMVDAINSLLEQGEKFALYLTALVLGHTDDEMLLSDAVDYCSKIEAIAKEL